MRNLFYLGGFSVLVWLATAASASPFVEFQGKATGCWGSGCTPAPWVSPDPGAPDPNFIIDYHEGQFDLQTDAAGHLSIGSPVGNLGYISVAPSDTPVAGEIFNLLVTFTRPTGAGPSTFSAIVEGSATGVDTGGVTIDFDNTNQLFTYDGGSFTFGVNDIDVTPNGDPVMLTGHIQLVDPTPSVPEPATWAMMLLGFCTVGVAARRRRKTMEFHQLA